MCNGCVCTLTRLVIQLKSVTTVHLIIKEEREKEREREREEQSKRKLNMHTVYTVVEKKRREEKSRGEWTTRREMNRNL